MKKWFFMWILGRGMLPLAELALKTWISVTGYDANISTNNKKLYLGDDCYIYDDWNQVSDFSYDAIITSWVFSETHPFLNVVWKHNIPVYTRMQWLQLLIDQFCETSINVLGSYGKSSTTTLLATMLQHAWRDPFVYIGAETSLFPGGIQYGHGKIAVVETCEYQKAMLDTKPTYVLLTTLKENHTDCYPTMESIYDAFDTYFTQSSSSLRLLAICADDVEVDYFSKSSYAQYIITYGYEKPARWMIRSYKTMGRGMLFDVEDTQTSLCVTLYSPLPGIKNALNTLWSYIILNALGIESDVCNESMKSFTGLNRRFEYKFESDDLTIIDDMARQPEQIESTLSSIRELYPEHCIVVMHGCRWSRSKRNIEKMAEIIRFADYHYIPSVWENGSDFGGAEDQDADEKLLLAWEHNLSLYDSKILLQSHGYSLQKLYKHVKDTTNKKLIICSVGYDSYIPHFAKELAFLHEYGIFITFTTRN